MIKYCWAPLGILGRAAVFCLFLPAAGCRRPPWLRLVVPNSRIITPWGRSLEAVTPFFLPLCLFSVCLLPNLIENTGPHGPPLTLGRRVLRRERGHIGQNWGQGGHQVHQPQPVVRDRPGVATRGGVCTILTIVCVSWVGGGSSL